MKDEGDVPFDEEESNWTTFKRDDDGVYVEARQIEALLKETMDTLDINKGKGSVARKQTMQHGLFVKPKKIHLMRDGESIEEPDGYEERPIHVMGFRGPRTALTREDYVENAEIEFEVWVVIPNNRENPHIRKGHLEDMLELGQENGLGASRTQGYGKYDLDLFEELD